MKRILFYESRPEWGGAQMCELELLTSLENHEIKTFFLTSTYGPMVSRVKAAGKNPTIIPIHDDVNGIRKGQVKTGLLFIFRHLFYMLPHLIGVIFFIVRYRINIVYTSQFRSQLIIGWLAKALGRRVIWHIHGEEKLDNLLGKIAVSTADQMIVVSSSIMDRYRTLYPGKNFIVVPNGVEVQYTTPRKSAAPFTISMVASLIESKRQDLAIAACTRLSQLGYSIQLYLIGDKPPWHSDDYLNMLKQAATSTVQFLGWVENPGNYLCQSDVFILPSDTEGMPLSIIEAMAHGLPCISTNVGGVPEVIMDSETGFIIETGSVDELIEKLIYLMENPDECVQMSQKARKRYELLFTKETFVKGVRGVINTVA